MTERTYIVSDVHLGAVPAETERAFLGFLAHVRERAGRLILAGDLFDFWFEYGPVVIGRHYRVLSALAELVEADVDVLMVGGNHDAWGGRFLRERVGIRFHADPVRTELAGRPALIAHGDGLGTGDLKYRALKAVLRSRLAVAAFRALHPEIGHRLARAVSSTETKTEPPDVTRGRARMIEAWAVDRLREDPALGWVVCGHAHLPAVREVEPGRFYLNAGDWVRHDSYIVVSPGETPRIRSWSHGSAADA
ncbi:MAG: UDP-2,3-diacylglucosamine diphosphatase [Gemmatimonadota bacterium]